MVGLQVFSLIERPDLVNAFWSVPGDWPEFMLHDPVADLFYGRAVEQFPDLHLLAVDGDDVVGRLHAVPVPWSGLHGLSARGWDWAVSVAQQVHAGDRAAVSLVEARITPSRRGQGLSQQLLAAARSRFAALGTRDLVGPVRPTGKARQPATPAAQYAGWLGGRMVRVAPPSMTIPGTLAQWRDWTGLPLDTDGAVEVAGGLSPVHVDVAQDHAVYVEANVWVHHQLAV